MPPSPALRYSPRREQKPENHKRGRSFEGNLLMKEKDDDDLALFNEMQSKERDDFLLRSYDDFEDTFSTKLKQFSDFKLGISIPARGESSELLNVEGEKNDYDWLLTPPDTPLFPSLDDEPQPVNVSSRGRPRSQPITISRQSTMEKSYRSSRGSASPNRLSPSPRSGNSSLQSRGRTSSAPLSSPPLSHRAATPPRRPSPPPVKPSTSAPRSSTPVRTNRGNSASPKIRAWQSNIPGFSSEAPPNLRTDRPATYVRGSSPSSSRYGRQSMSPTASRSASSSHSQDRDRVSSNSRGSIASSGDDDVDSLQSIHVGSLDRFASKRTGMVSSNRVPALSKKSTRAMSPSSAPKRPFDSALRHMDNRKSPQNMFRPLMSSVPSSTFYIGKATSVHRPFISRNSPVTTPSNPSTVQGSTSVAPFAHHLEDMEVESEKTTHEEEIFAFDKSDMLNKDIEHNTDDGLVQFQVDDFDDSHGTEPKNSEKFGHQEVDMEISSEIDSLENRLVCSECACKYNAIETIEDINLCPDCRRQHSKTTASLNPLLLSERVSELQSQESSLARALIEEVDQRLTGQHGIGQASGSHRRSGSDSNDFRTLKMDISEGAGISVLLKRSNSTKGPVVQSRTFVASSSITYDDLRSSVGHGSISASSSIDVSSNRQVDTRFQRQLSENYRFDPSVGDMRNDHGIERASHSEANVSNASFAEQNSYEHCPSHENEDVLNNGSSVSNVEIPVLSTNASVGLECDALSGNTDRLNDAGVPPHCSLVLISEIETENGRKGILSSENDDFSVNSKGVTNEIQDSSMEHVNSGPLNGISGEENSTVMLQQGSKSRSLTLEEATDTILFCSSIVHDIAYQAATIAIEKQDAIIPLEGSRPTVTILGKSSADRKDSRNRTPTKRPSKSQKVKQKRMEVDIKSPSRKTENDENASESMVRNTGAPNNMDSTKPPKLESKCNCSIM